MKVGESLKIVDQDWVRKTKGYRVCFQKIVNSELVTDFCPAQDNKPLDSYVTTWRLAWKLAVSTQTEGNDIVEDELVNIYVVDDLGNPIKYYATNKTEVLNPKGTLKEWGFLYCYENAINQRLIKIQSPQIFYSGCGIFDSSSWRHDRVEYRLSIGGNLTYDHKSFG